MGLPAGESPQSFAGGLRFKVGVLGRRFWGAGAGRRPAGPGVWGSGGASSRGGPPRTHPKVPCPILASFSYLETSSQ